MNELVVEAPDWLDELQLSAGGPPWLSMGLSRVGASGWLLPDGHRSAELAERQRLLAGHHDEVFAAQPGTEAAGDEVGRMVRTWFAERRPDVVLPADASDIHPLEAAGRLVQEDLCLMVRHGDVHHLDAACLCFPSHWRLADKLGRPAAVMHEPVPRYDSELASRVDRYLHRLRPGSISQRRNWSVHDSPDLFAPGPPAEARRLDVEDVADALWLRSERQTLRRLPGADAVLFTIRVQQTPFRVLTRRPDVARRLADRLAAQPAELTTMNGLDGYRDVVLRWLERISDGRQSPSTTAKPRG